MKKCLISLILLVFILFVASCKGSSQQASYILKDSNLEIVFEIKSKHKFLAEYNRFLVVKKNGTKILRQILFPDTGGYSASNLYRCNKYIFMLKGYHDNWVVDINRNSIIEGNCSNENPEYLGIYDGGGRKPLKFYTALERKESKLKAGGG